MRREDEPLDAVTAYLGLGGNVGDVTAAIAQALIMIDQNPACCVTAVSKLYTTPPWGKTDQDWFINGCARVETTLDVHELLDLVQMAERQAGRERRERWGPRTLDIDILLFGDQSVSDERLTVPHKHMLERAFVLVPLADIAADVLVGGKSISRWCADIDATSITMSKRQVALDDIQAGILPLLD